MISFEGVRLRNGLGGVNRLDGTVMNPPVRESFGVAEGADRNCELFYVADTVSTPGGIAVLVNDRTPLLHDEAQQRTTRRLLDAGFPAVVWIGPEAPGAAVVHCYGDGEGMIENAACGVWALKALGGWDETDLMTFHITHVAGTHRERQTIRVLSHAASWVSVHGEHGPRGWTVDAARLRPGAWTTLLEDVCGGGVGASAKAVILADVDWAMAYNDAYGHQEGDLMLARLHACIESAALRARAGFVRVGGEEYAVIVDGTVSDAESIAEAIKHGVEAMNIPFEHAEVRTHGRVTVSIGIALAKSGKDLRKDLEDAVDEAKRSGRDRISMST
jgi:diguanylate cyclase (GGDEF)-like protein